MRLTLSKGPWRDLRKSALYALAETTWNLTVAGNCIVLVRYSHDLSKRN